jgi:hypothetical protein
MDERYWEHRDADARHRLMLYASELQYAVAKGDEAAVEHAITGIHMAQTLRKIASYELTQLRTPTPTSLFFDKMR